jgi:hypothetical protein
MIKLQLINADIIYDTAIVTSWLYLEKHGKVQQHWGQKRKKHVYAQNELKLTVI